MKSLKNILSNPLADSRLWALWIWNKGITETEMIRQLHAFVEKGFGGVAIRPGKDMYPAYLSEEFFSLFGKVLQIASEKKIGVRIADDFSLSWDTTFHRYAQQNSGCRAHKLVLDKCVVVTPKDSFELPADQVESHIIICAKMTDKKIDPGSAKQLLPEQKDMPISWKPTSGDWQIMKFKKLLYLDLSGYFVPNVFNTKVAQFYIQEVLEKFIVQFSSFIPSTFMGFVSEVPAYLPSEQGIPWDDDLITKYRSRYKKNLVDVIPSLFFDVDDVYAKNRSHVYNFIHQSMYERFVAVLESWAQKNQFSHWVLCPERDVHWTDHCLTDVLAVPSAQIACAGLQNQEGTERNSALLRTMADLNSIEYARETIAVIGRSRFSEGATLQSLKSEIENLAVMGVSKIILDGCFFNLEQSCYVKTPFNHTWYHPEWEYMQQVCDYCAKIISLYKNTTRSSSIAVVFPSSSIMADYLPHDDSQLRKGLRTFQDVLDVLQNHNCEFDIITEQHLMACSVKTANEENISDGTSKDAYQVIIFPYARLINNSVFVFLEKLALKKTSIIFTNEAPQGNFDDGKSSSFDGRVSRLVNAKNGSVHVLPLNDIMSVLDTIHKSAISYVGEKIVPEIKSSKCLLLEHDLYYFVNESDVRDYFVTIEVPSAQYVYQLNITSGELFELTTVQRQDTTCIFDLNFGPRQTYLLLTSKTELTENVSQSQTHFFEENNRSYRVVFKDKWSFSPLSLNVMPLANLNKRIGLSREYGGFSYYYETYFEVEEIPTICGLLLFDTPIRDAKTIAVQRDFEVSVNGIVVTPLKKVPNTEAQNSLFEHFCGGSILKYDINTTIMKGINRIAFRTMGLSLEPHSIFYPPMVVGNFAIRKGSRGWTIHTAPIDASYGSWTKHGFPYLAGGGLYQQVFEIPSEYKHIILRLSQVSGCVSVEVNDVNLGLLSWQPMAIDVTKIVEQRRNTIKIKVYNTMDNILHMRNRQSGLIGEVYLDIY